MEKAPKKPSTSSKDSTTSKDTSKRKITGVEPIKTKPSTASKVSNIKKTFEKHPIEKKDTKSYIFESQSDNGKKEKIFCFENYKITNIKVSNFSNTPNKLETSKDASW